MVLLLVMMRGMILPLLEMMNMRMTPRLRARPYLEQANGFLSRRQGVHHETVESNDERNVE